MGRGDLDDIDINSSISFFDDLTNSRGNMKFNRALDCGAGIGRVSEAILSKRFAKVSIVKTRLI